MKTFLMLAAVGGIALSAVTALSQAPVPTPPAAPPKPVQLTGTPLQQLQQIRDQNAKIIEAQQATLKALDEMEKTSQQLKLFGKRS